MKTLYLNCQPPNGAKRAKVTTFREMAHLYAKSFPTTSGYTGDEEGVAIIGKAIKLFNSKAVDSVLLASYGRVYAVCGQSRANVRMLRALGRILPVKRLDEVGKVDAC